MTKKVEVFPCTVKRFEDSAFDAIAYEVWPEAWMHNEAADRYWTAMWRRSEAFRFYCTVDGQLAGTFYTTPVNWELGQPWDQLPVKGWEWVMESGASEHSDVSVVSAISMNIRKSFRGLGLSSKLLAEAKAYLRSAGVKSLIAPVRPTQKTHFPLIPLQDYLAWKDPQSGEIFDPWVRVHLRAGAQLIGVCEDSMVIQGSADQWKEWTGLQVIGPGNYIVKDALVPVRFSQAGAGTLIGRYVEPNVWMVHQVEASG